MTVSSSKVAVWNRALLRIGSTDFVEEEDEDSHEAEVCKLLYDDLLREVLEARSWPWAVRERPLSKIDSQSTTTDGDGATADFDVPYAFVDAASQLTVTLIDNTGAETDLDPDDGDYTITDDDEEDDSSRVYVTLTSIPAADESVRITVTTAREGWAHVYVLPSDCVTPLNLIYDDVRDSQVMREAKLPFEIVENDAGDGLLLCTDLDDTDFAGLRYVSAFDDVRAMPRQFVTAVAMRLATELAAALKKDEALKQECEKDYAKALSIAAANAQNLAIDVPTISPSLAALAGGASGSVVSDDDAP